MKHKKNEEAVVSLELWLWGSTTRNQPQRQDLGINQTEKKKKKKGNFSVRFIFIINS